MPRERSVKGKENRKPMKGAKPSGKKPKLYPKINSYDPKVWYNQFNKLYTDEAIVEIANTLLEWAKLKISENDHLLIGDFAIEYMLPEARFPEFARKVPYFGFVYTLVKKMQEQYFIKRGLMKEGNPTMEIFLLKSIHKYMEQNHVKLQMLDFSKLTTEQVQMIANGATIEEVLLQQQEKNDSGKEN